MGDVSYLAEKLGNPRLLNGPQMLRKIADRIESGEIKARNFVLVWEQEIVDNMISTSVNCCGEMGLTYLIGLLERAKTTIHLNAIMRVS